MQNLIEFEIYEVKDEAKDTLGVTLKYTGEKQLEFETSVEAISKNCILTWALTYPKIQGITETGTICLHDLGFKHFRKCHLYVGLSRVTNGSNMFVSPE